MKLEDVKNDKEVNVLVDNTERQLTELGYTEHGRRHIGIVSDSSPFPIFSLFFNFKSYIFLLHF